MRSLILDYNEQNGLVYCDNYIGAKNNAERLYVSEVKKLKAQAVLFRRYYKNENESTPYHSDPAVCIFKEEDIVFNSANHIELHAAIWSSGRNEIYIIHGKTRIDIINARKPAESDNGSLTIKNLRLASEVIRDIDKEQFSAYLFGSGTFWEQTKFKDKLNEKSSPHIHLLNYLMAVRKRFLDPLSGINLKPHTIDKLLVVSMLVKFLEEIKDSDNGQHTLRAIYKKHRVTSFIDAVDGGVILNIFENLAIEFKGRIFDRFDDSEKNDIRKADLNLLAQFLQANIDLNTDQLFFWEQYSFKHLPAEVISAIYENFVQAEAQRQQGKKEKGIVYTPIHLVNFLIDEVMPLNKASEFFGKERFRVLDPACGSGVFLVAAYKRLLQWWALNNSSDYDIQYPNSKIAQRILENNIFGVDVKGTAILVSIFGLTTALLDKLKPKEIWNKLKLKDLGEKNIQRKSFFKWAATAKANNEVFDLVIGNPPFNPESDSGKIEVLNIDILKKIDLINKNVPRNNFALHFFEGSMTVANKICMILPANVVLYDNANVVYKYRKDLFTNFTVTHIYDFSHLRRDLFHKAADIPVVALIALNSPSNRQAINHTVIKRMISSEKKFRFEIDYYDTHKVPWSWATDPDKQFIWKTNLLGGGRLFHLIHRLSLLPTLQSFIKKSAGWQNARGFEGGTKIKLKYQDRIISIKANGAPDILHDVHIETDNLKSKFLYEPPFLVIDQVLGDNYLPSCFIPIDNQVTRKAHLYYSRDFIGISSPEADEGRLKEIHDFIRLKKAKDQLNYQLYLLATSSSCLVLTETDVNLSEILNLPYPGPEKMKYLLLSRSEKIVHDDVLRYYRHLGKSIRKDAPGTILYDKVDRLHLEEYGITLCEALNTIYEKCDKSWQLGKFFQTSSFTICQIGFGKKNGLKHEYYRELDRFTDALVTNNLSNSGTLYKRIIRFYIHQDGNDCVYIIKPHALRYWLKSIALRDADDTFSDLRDEGF